MSLNDALVHLREQNCQMTYELVVYCAAFAIFQYVAPLHGQGSSKFQLSNPLQGILYHFLLTEVFCKVLEMGLVEEFLNLAPADNPTKFRQTRIASLRKTEELELFCDENSIPVPNLKTFYFKKPSEFEEPFLLPADATLRAALASKISAAEDDSQGNDY